MARMTNVPLRGLLWVVVGLSLALCMPKKDEFMFESRDDTAVVESTVRMARAAPKHIDDLLKPGVKDAYLHVYGDKAQADGDLHGYIKRTNDKGADGYKHFDTFHKKDGDKYGYESHSEYGQGNKAKYDSEKEKKGSKKGSHGAESQDSYKIHDESDDSKEKKAVEPNFGYYGDDADGFYPKGQGESNYEEGTSETTSYSNTKKTGDGDGEGESYHESDGGSYESSYESDEAEDGDKGGKGGGY